ncbi:Helix-turn-helix domain-containing protein [Geodermatophilus dictyosporus]|uniref:Helix-turn-helix domain-containing protein n=1 Tax=Geodermatophilus dictyosporus TaxID=1523247 RepID=A0A1I5NHM4_9ACTN|nr:helix-turn-helix transcriptional regulator [Geodermatophilus dictyosporus]SFP21303.1 Helix-turn-helix domain-containing protein [Geodermatophilus dictyosporus]
MPTGPAAPRRVSLATSDPVEARAFLDRAYGGRLQVSTTPDTSWRMSLDQVDADAVSSAVVQVPADLTFDMVRRGDLVINALLDGGLRFDHGKSSDRFGPGDVCLANHPGSEGVARTREVRLRAVTLSERLLTDVSGGTADGRVGPAQFLSLSPVTGGTSRWWATNRFVDDLLREPVTAASPLLIAQASRLLAATALAVFPNTVVPPPTPADRTDAHPVTLRRATAFIEANCERDVSLADIARAASVTPRAVQLAFRRHLDTTPLAHLRQLRLRRAHEQLSRATPGDGTTVTAVAAQWGFTPSRFTERYSAAYGALPSQTLRS